MGLFIRKAAPADLDELVCIDSEKGIAPTSEIYDRLSLALNGPSTESIFLAELDQEIIGHAKIDKDIGAGTLHLTSDQKIPEGFYLGEINIKDKFCGQDYEKYLVMARIKEISKSQKDIYVFLKENKTLYPMYLELGFTNSGIFEIEEIHQRGILLKMSLKK